MVNSDVEIALAISDGIVDIGQPLLQDRGAFLPPMRRKKSQNEVAYNDITTTADRTRKCDLYAAAQPQLRDEK